MNGLEIFLLSVGLAMDAFSVSVCKGLGMKRLSIGSGAVIALFFGAFQAGMPLIGYFLGISFAKYISSISHWVAFFLLGIIGGKMIIESFHGEESEEFSLKIGELLLLAVATSIDALAVGVVFAAQKTRLLLSVSVIGVVTFLLSLLGVVIGHKFGSCRGNRAECIGGCILIIIGTKLLLDGLGII